MSIIISIITKRKVDETLMHNGGPHDGFNSLWTVGSFKSLIIDHMVLGGDTLSVQVANKSDSKRMVLGESEELATSRSGLPAWYFLFILKGRI